MDKPTAIGRLLRRAKTASAAATEAGEEPAADRGEGDLALEAGIAEIFATIRSGGGNDRSPNELPEDTGATYALLSRLNQLWQTPEPGQS